MELPASRITIHQNDKTVAWAHPPLGRQEPHNHVIPEGRTPYEKSSLGDHIDLYHVPLRDDPVRV
jgi:hypothetical protein